MLKAQSWLAALRCSTIRAYLPVGAAMSTCCRRRLLNECPFDI